MRTAIFTIDTESYEAKKKSAAGEALKRMLEQNRLEVKAAKVLPRDKEVVATVFRQLADSGSVELIITTGATGYLEQDCAPKAVEEVAEQLIPGIPEALRHIISGIPRKQCSTVWRQAFGKIHLL